MKLFIKILAIPILLVVVMIFVNESSHLIKVQQCSWACHNNTRLCKQNHTIFLKPHINKIDVAYNFIISSLGATGNYRLANIIFLVVLWPLLMLALFTMNIILFKKLSNG